MIDNEWPPGSGPRRRASGTTQVPRRQLLIGAASLLPLLPAPLTAEAQQARRAYRIGVLFPFRHPLFLEPFVDAMGELGWVQGREFTLEARYGGLEVADALARELVVLKIDLFVTLVTGMAAAAKRASAEIPIVMITSGYPVEARLAESLARPGGNVTGNTIYVGSEIFGKYLELLKTAVPKLTRVAVLWDYVPPVVHPAEGTAGAEALRRAAGALGVSLRFWETRTSGDVDVALTAASRDRFDAAFVSSGPAHTNPDTAARILRFAVEHRLPTMTDFAGGFFRAGALMTYSPNARVLARQAARFVDRILRGARPADLPIEQPSKFDLIINLKTARALGLTIPSPLLARADQVIE